MQDFLIDIGMTALLGLLQREIPADGSKKGKWRKAFLKLFTGIATIYAGDSEFQAAFEKAKKH